MHADPMRCWRIYSGCSMPEAETYSWRWEVVSSRVYTTRAAMRGKGREGYPQDLLPKLCQFAVIVSWRSGERGFVGEWMGLGGSGGREVLAIVARREPKIPSY